MESKLPSGWKLKSGTKEKPIIIEKNYSETSYEIIRPNSCYDYYYAYIHEYKQQYYDRPYLPLREKYFKSIEEAAKWVDTFAKARQIKEESTCPFCGSKINHVEFTYWKTHLKDEVFDLPRSNYAFVVCDECCAHGPRVSFKMEVTSNPTAAELKNKTIAKNAAVKAWIGRAQNEHDN